MAFECPALMKALVAWSSTHLALRDPSFNEIALRHRGAAFSAWKASMNEENISKEMTLAVTMVFCSMESIFGDTDAWYYHLVGGAAAIGAFEQSGSSKSSQHARFAPFEGLWLLRGFAYHDVLMSVSSDSRPLLSGDCWIGDDDDVADPYFGLAKHIICHIADISHLIADFEEFRKEGNTEDRQRQRRLRLQVRSKMATWIFNTQLKPREMKGSPRERKRLKKSC